MLALLEYYVPEPAAVVGGGASVGNLYSLKNQALQMPHKSAVTP